MYISNNKNTTIIDTEEIYIFAKVKNTYAGTFDIAFYNRHNASQTNWSFKLESERDKVLDILKRKLAVTEINDTDITL